MKKFKNLKWLVGQAVKRTRYKGGSYRRGVEITGHDIIRNAVIAPEEKERCIKEVVEQLKRPHDYSILTILFVDGKVREATPEVNMVKNITVRELDAVIHEIIVNKAEATVRDEDWAYAFMAAPDKKAVFTEEEIDVFIDELEANQIWDQDKKLAILKDYALELSMKTAEQFSKEGVI